jgi:hypothetical protein
LCHPIAWPCFNQQILPATMKVLRAPAASGFAKPHGMRLACFGLPQQDEDRTMARCEVCGNDYDKAFEIIQRGKSHIFDSFECAIHALAPTCSHCGCRIIGHGMEAEGEFFCCAYCAKHAGAPQMKDRAESATPT